MKKIITGFMALAGVVFSGAALAATGQVNYFYVAGTPDAQMLSTVSISATNVSPDALKNDNHAVWSSSYIVMPTTNCSTTREITECSLVITSKKFSGNNTIFNTYGGSPGATIPSTISALAIQFVNDGNIYSVQGCVQNNDPSWTSTTLNIDIFYHDPNTAGTALADCTSYEITMGKKNVCAAFYPTPPFGIEQNAQLAYAIVNH